MLRWAPLAATLLLAAGLRFATLDLQSFWYDEAFTPVHVLHQGLGATLHSVVRTENSPPLWYVIAWADVRLFGDGELALRLPSALAGVATVFVAWAIGRELCGRRCALLAGALVAVNPLFVWYSQEARAYALFALTSALAMLCFLRALREPTARRMGAFALSGALALLSHYFAVFLLAPMALWLLAHRRTRRAALPALLALTLVGAALAPLLLAQGGHGTQWIGRWAFGSRVQSILQYFLVGPSGAPLGHGIELLIALPVLAVAALAAWRMTARPDVRAARVALAVAAAGVLVPIVLAVFGADYLAPRNLLAAMIPVSALLAVLLAAPQLGRWGALLAALIIAAFLTVSVDVDLSPRLQRGNWRELARALGRAPEARAIATVQLGSAPLEYYLQGVRELGRRSAPRVSEIDLVGYRPLRRSAGRSPASGFTQAARAEVDGLIAYRFTATRPHRVSRSALRAHAITSTRTVALVQRART